MVYKVYKDGVLVSNDSLFEVGDYTVEMYAAKSTVYNESNHVTVNLTVKESLFDITFESSSVIADGGVHELVINGELPSGYTVSYTNNSGSEAGSYFAKAEILDANGSVVETHAAVLEIENPKNMEFDAYLSEFFVLYLEEDQLAVNIFC